MMASPWTVADFGALVLREMVPAEGFEPQTL